MDLAHYSTFENNADFIARTDKNYNLAIQSSFMEIDERTQWVNNYIINHSKQQWSVKYNVDSFMLQVNNSEYRISEFASKLEKPSSTPLIDATSLSYPEIQYLFYWLNKINCPFDLVYVEPEKYTEKKVPVGEVDYLLSDDGPGVMQLAPFLGTTVTQDTINVISIGFEGHRVAGLLNNDQLREPGFDDVRLVLGVPAFKAGYDRVSIIKNIEVFREVLKLQRYELDFAAANNPYSMIHLLEKIKSTTNIMPDTPIKSINLIPFGTKPAAIGMAWFAAKYQEDIIVTYDHVVKLPGRSEGVGRIHLASFR
ncbi:MAG: hypothetical protein PSN44_03650 [Gammaproteobacteria bacterium]|nr:hypothetical protein [Gammaproteobacteria bacterium]